MFLQARKDRVYNVTRTKNTFRVIDQQILFLMLYLEILIKEAIYVYAISITVQIVKRRI